MARVGDPPRFTEFQTARIVGRELVDYLTEASIGIDPTFTDRV